MERDEEAVHETHRGLLREADVGLPVKDLCRSQSAGADTAGRGIRFSMLAERQWTGPTTNVEGESLFLKRADRPRSRWPLTAR